MFEPTTSFGLLALTAGLAVTLIALRWAAGLSLSSAARRLLHRFLLPMLELALAAMAALSLLAWVSADLPLQRLVALAIIVLAIGWAGRGVLADFVNGIVLRVEGSLDVGQNLQVGAVDGRVHGIGYRALVVETDDGSLVRVPFSRIARDNLATTVTTAGQRAHTFTVEVPRDRSLGQILAEVPAAVLLSPWSSVTRMPRVELRGESDQNYLLEVTAYSLDAAYASRIEATLRQALASPARGP